MRKEKHPAAKATLIVAIAVGVVLIVFLGAWGLVNQMSVLQ